MDRKFKTLLSLLFVLIFAGSFAAFRSDASALSSGDRAELERYVDVLRRGEKDFANTKTDKYLIVSKGEGEINKCEQEKIDYEGILATKIDDFDGDGREELLVARIKTAANRNVVSLGMYAKSGDEIKNVAETALTDHAISGDRFVNEIAYKKLNGSALIYFVADSNVSINADGYFWYYNSVRYNKDGFYALTGKSYMGTQKDEKDLQECANYVKADGINITKFVGEESFSKYDSDVKVLSNVNLKHTTDTFYKYVDDPALGKSVKVKFGELSFNAY